MKMNYTTQMDAAKRGIITREMEIVSKKENMDIEVLREKIAKGHIVIPANKNHKSLDPEGIGSGLRTKINVNLGISRDCPDVDLELDKVKTAIDMKAEAIMDLSSFGKTEEFRQELVKMSTAMIGTVPIYDAVGFYDKELKDITEKEFLDVVRKHGKDGVDFVTIHAGLNRDTVKTFKKNKRVTNIVSRGGSLLEDMKEGIIASRIAAHAGDLAKGVKGAEEWDLKMSVARQELDWEEMFNLSLDKEKARRYRKESSPEHEDSCTMCGKMCSMRNMNRIMDGKDINILRNED